MTVYQCDESQEYYFKEGCFILEMLNDPSDPDVSIARARVSQGVTTKLHRLANTVERYVVLQGRGEVTVGEQLSEVSAGDVVLIPADTPQCIRNSGQEDLVFLAICSPRFLADNYFEVTTKL